MSDNAQDDHQERQHWFDVMRAFLTYDEFLECDVSKPLYWYATI